MMKQSPHGSIHQPPCALSAQALRLLSAATAYWTKISYLRSLQLLEQLLQPSSIKLPLPDEVADNFVAIYSATNTVLPSLPPMFQQLVMSIRSRSRRHDSFPSHKENAKSSQWHQTSYYQRHFAHVNALNFVVSDPQIRLLLRTLFVLAFNAFMQLGELVCESYPDADKSSSV